MDRTARLAPLGMQRLRLLDCLGGASQWAPGYFNPSADSEIFEAFATYVKELSSHWARESDPLAISLLAAGRLLTGEKAAAHVIVDCLPVEAFDLDHGAGYCVTAPLLALKAALPLPSDLRDTTRWVSGSPEQVRLRAWLDAHEHDLRWFQQEGVYRLEEP